MEHEHAPVKSTTFIQVTSLELGAYIDGNRAWTMKAYLTHDVIAKNELFYDGRLPNSLSAQHD